MYDGDSSHDQELENLSLLNQLKHPNILELLTFYTYQRKRNFLFPLASGGDLEALFREDPRPVHFSENFSFYYALCGLSSAIEKIHDYTTEKNLHVRLIGLHQDLKPSNILVDADNFIVADFGLSKFKSGSQTSKTPFRVGGGDYLAPECEDYNNCMEKGLLNRSSDIWSFGCIIAEVLTYMLQGAKGVAEFRATRKILVQGWKVGIFCEAGGKINPNVLQWLSKLKESCAPSGRQLVDLIKTMLSTSQECRPIAPIVTYNLRLVTINELLDTVKRKYEFITTMSSLNQTQGLQTYIEFVRFQSWQFVFDSMISEMPEGQATVINLDLNQSIELLRATYTELALISVRYEVAAQPVFFELKQLNDKLISLFSVGLRASAQSYQELQLLSEETCANVAYGLLTVGGVLTVFPYRLPV